MQIRAPRRFVFWFDARGHHRPLPPATFDLLCRGEPRIAFPQFASRRVDFAVLGLDPTSSGFLTTTEHYPRLIFGTDGRLDIDLHYQLLQLGVDTLEATDYAGTPALVSPSEWVPDDTTRARLVATVERQHPSSRRHGLHAASRLHAVSTIPPAPRSLQSPREHSPRPRKPSDPSSLLPKA